jgi:predicted nucleic acid-binding Zn ribbon protein
MLVELAAANAAFQVIKTAIKNGGEIVSAGQALLEYFNNKSKLQEKVESKPEHKRNDLEEFLALEQLKKQEQELKELMIYNGRPGLWDDWQSFQVKARQQREAEHRQQLKEKLEKKAKRDRIIQDMLLTFWILVLILVVVGCISGAIYLTLEYQ